MYHYLNTYMFLKISTNSSKHLDFKGAIKDLFLWVSLSNKTYVFLLFRATDQGEQRIGMVSLVSPGEQKEKPWRPNHSWVLMVVPSRSLT